MVQTSLAWPDLSRSNLPPEVWRPPGAGYFEVNRPPLKLFAQQETSDKGEEERKKGLVTPNRMPFHIGM